MDPLAHTLVGATLARTRFLGGDLPYRMTTLVVAANLPDIDVFAYVAGSDAALLHRRGITHGPLGLLVLPALFVGALLLFDRWRRGRGRNASVPGAPPPLGGLLVLAYVGTLSHPLLDWLNTYGVRLLFPFSERWFYGDVLFIVDPWFWLLLAAGLFLGSRATTRVNGRWLALAVVATTFIGIGPIPNVAKILWIVTIGSLVVGRSRRGDLSSQSHRVASFALAAWLIYLAIMIAAAFAARADRSSGARTTWKRKTSPRRRVEFHGWPTARDPVRTRCRHRARDELSGGTVLLAAQRGWRAPRAARASDRQATAGSRESRPAR